MPAPGIPVLHAGVLAGGRWPDKQRTWLLITESPEGGWGIDGRANTNAGIAANARAALVAG